MTVRRYRPINYPQSGGTEVNDLTAAVTWANVPDVNITESSVTQHEAALTLTESQVEAALSSTTAFTVGNYVFNTDQTVGAGQDNYVLTYDHGTGEIGLEAAATGGGGQILPYYEFTFSDTTTVADPGAGYFRLNRTTPSSMTQFIIDDLDANGVDRQAVFGNLKIGHYIRIVSKDDFSTGNPTVDMVVRVDTTSIGESNTYWDWGCLWIGGTDVALTNDENYYIFFDWDQALPDATVDGSILVSETTGTQQGGWEELKGIYFSGSSSSTYFRLYDNQNRPSDYLQFQRDGSGWSIANVGTGGNGVIRSSTTRIENAAGSVEYIECQNAVLTLGENTTHVRSKANTQILESASATSSSGYGTLWVKNNTPNTLHFKDDGGTEHAVATSSGTTGGTGSAGSGNQYVEIKIEGTTYKVLHDGTV
jgi:hypothetical protein